MFRSAKLEQAAEAKDAQEGPSLTRRQLLMLGAAGCGMMAASGIATRAASAEDLVRGGRSISRTTGSFRRAVASTCRHCPARCGILGFVEDGKLVKIEGNPRDPNSRGRLCARGQAGINRLYDPDRVLFPMERVGRRGEGKWVRLSWDQAYDLLSDKLRQLQARDPNSLVLHAGREGPGLMGRRFVAAFGSKGLVDETLLRDASRMEANRLVMGTGDEVADVANARYILNFGGNPYESHPAYVPFVQRLVDARMGGARLVTFDPRLSFTAGRSDEWFSIMPGTDAAIALAMANVIVQQGLHDRQFLSRWSDLSPDELGALLAPYTPEAAEAASGMRAEDIRRIATEFARIHPVVAILGGGVNHQTDSIDTQRAVILLNTLVGSVGVQGGYCPAPTISFPDPEPAPLPTTTGADSLQLVDELIKGNRSTAIYITSLANPAYSWPGSESFQSMLKDEKRVQYLVAIDTNLTETSMLADLVLPAAAFLERWGLESPVPQELRPFVTVQQPVVAPLGESLSPDDILLTLGTRLDEKAASYFAFPTVEAYLNAIVNKTPALSQVGGLNLLKTQGVWSDLATSPRYRPRDDRFGTASGKLELKTGLASRAATIQKTTLSVGTLADEGQLTLVTYSPNVHSGDYSADCWWLAEIAHNNVLLMSPAAAQQRGIRQGQRVKVVSPVGSANVSVRITHGIHPQVVALASGFGHQALGRVARAQRFKSEDPNTAYFWWGDHGNGVNASSLIDGKAGSSGGGLVWMDTKVKIEAMG